MNPFFQHIEFLLLLHDCVVIPGLGAFIVNMVPAHIDYEKRVVTPPSRSLMFNQAVALDDGLLANSIARKNSISFEDARQIVVRHVALFKEELEKSGKASVGNLGTLSMGEEGNIIFSPAESNFFSPFAIGYASIPLQFHSDSTDPQQESENTQSSDRRFNLRITPTFTKIAVMVAVILTVVITVILNPLPSDNREQRASVVPVESILKSTPATPAIEKSIHVTDSIPAPAIKEESEPAIPNHYIIVATFRSAKEAEEYATKNSTSEFQLSAIPSRKVTRVAVAASDNKAELQKELNSRTISSKFPKAWIWSRN